MAEIEIRDEGKADQAVVFEIERSAFDSRVQADLVDALRESAEPYVSLVASEGGELVGHIFFSPVTFAQGVAPRAAQLSPVAVAPSHHRLGIGSALIVAGLERCREMGWRAVFLVGDPRFYSRFGFELARPGGLSCEGPHDPFLQVIELDAGALSGVSGLVRFHRAFEGL